MVPLLEIKTVPIEIQVKTKDATLEFSRGTAEMEVSRTEQGGVDVRSRPIHVRLDSFESRTASPRMQTSAPASAPVASGSVLTPAPAPTAYEATTAYADQGQLMLNARIGGSQQSQQPAEQSSYAQSAQSSQSAQSASPMDWEDGSMEIRYEMDKLNFDWKIEKGEFKFTPGDIQFTVKQRPDIIIKYTGGPIYVPRSSDPNYRPVDVQV